MESMLQVVAVPKITGKGLLVSDRLGLLHRHHRTVVDTSRQLRQMPTGCNSQITLERIGRDLGELPDGRHAEGQESLFGHRTDAPQRPDSHRMEEAEFVASIYFDNTWARLNARPRRSRLGRLGGQLGDELGSADSDRAAQPHLLEHAASDGAPHAGPVPEKAYRSGYIKERLVE